MNIYIFSRQRGQLQKVHYLSLFLSPYLTISIFLLLLLLQIKERNKIERMTKCVSPDAISTILANPSPESSSDVPEIVVQVIELKATGASGNRFM